MAATVQSPRRQQILEKAHATVKGMAPWFKDIGTKHKRGDKRDGRTREECIFDSGVFAASEFVRRMTGDEDLSLAVHEVCVWAQKARARGEKI